MMVKELICVALIVSITASYAIVIHPGDDKRKAFPLPEGRGSRNLSLSAEPPWRIADSSIIARDSTTMWRRQNATSYNLVDAYAPEEYVVIYGWLKQDQPGAGLAPEFMLTVPAIDLQWDEGCGNAAQEQYEDTIPMALLVTSDRTQNHYLVVNPAKDRNDGFSRHVTLEWTGENYVRVWLQSGNNESLISSGTQLNLSSPARLRIEPIAVSSSYMRFTARGLYDDYGGSRVEDSVKAFTYDLRVRSINFNYKQGATEDGMNLRRNYYETFPAGNEWTAENGATTPICYKLNQSISIMANFATKSSLLNTAKIGARNAIGDQGQPCCFQIFEETDVRFNRGLSLGPVKFTMTGTAPSAISLFEHEHLTWFVSSVNNNENATQNVITNSGPHRVYTIIANPALPWWGNASQNRFDIWTNALDFVVSTIGCIGISSADEALSKITQHLFSRHGLQYDSISGVGRYTSLDLPNENIYVNLTDYIYKHSGNIVNCYDQAAGLILLARLIGIDAQYKFMAPFGYINTINLVGVGSCNNPFYMASPYINAPVVNSDLTYPNRSGFGNHAFVEYNGYVFDACAGPAVGTQSILQYINTTIDRSTPEEVNFAGTIQDIHDIYMIIEQ